jgi:beta-galactosidase GanA
VRERPGTGERALFLLNYTADAQTVTLKQSMLDMLTGEPAEGELTLAPYDVRVLAPPA